MTSSLLTAFSRAILKKYKPAVIAITGSIGKTTTKEACFAVLKEKFRVWKSEKNFNATGSIPLAIIGVRPDIKPFARFFLAFFKALWLIVARAKGYPEILILEFGADRPGDIAEFLTYITPTIGIITTINHAHRANFLKFSQLVAEKRQVIEALSRDGYAVLNFDEEIVRATAKKTSARIVGYGVKSEDVEVKAEEQKMMIKEGKFGLYFKLLHKGTATPLFVEGCPEHQIYSMLAAASCGFIYQLTPIEVARGLESVRALPGRFELRTGKSEIWVIDDTYNAAPVSVCAALNSLAALPFGKRRIAVLADMLELGSFSKKGHRMAGDFAAQAQLDFLATFGNKSKLVGAAAISFGMPKEKVRHFKSITDLIAFMKTYCAPEDVILIKGSRAMKMERVADALCVKRIKGI